MRNILRPVYLGAALSLFAAVSSADADEKFSQLKVGAEVYSNVVVTTVTATDIYFSHSRGMGNAKLKSLSPELQKHFHYNAAKASAVEQQHREGNARYREALATNVPAAPSPGHGSATGADDGDVVVPKLYAKSFRGEHVPDIYVQQWLGSAPDLSSKFGLVVFWSPDSDPCKEAIPHLNELYEKFKDTVGFFGMTDKPADEVKKMTSTQIDFPIAIDTEQRTMRLIELQAIPHVMLVDKQGIVRFEGTPAYLTEKVLQRLLDSTATSEPGGARLRVDSLAPGADATSLTFDHVELTGANYSPGERVLRPASVLSFFVAGFENFLSCSSRREEALNRFNIQRKFEPPYVGCYVLKTCWILPHQ